tara:strand:+ start:1172 stop:1819 length:648 start_codon:yes stop_codon:yes gene_type:complete
MDKELTLKIRISEAGAERYLENPRFTIQSLAKKLNIDTTEIFELFPNRSEILNFYYPSRILVYKEQTRMIDNYPDYSLSEKLSLLILTLFDLFQDHREFVLSTYNKRVLCSMSTHSFETQFKNEIKQIFHSDSNISSASSLVINRAFYYSIYQTFNGFYYFWSRDTSSHYENTSALIDKWASFIQEVFYTKIADKGLDLGKFLFYHSPLNQFTKS